jgi:hypothetical protein
MNKLLILSLLALSYQTASATSLLETFGSGANAFTIDFVQIGNPGNAADTTGSPNPAGSVNYIYNLGKYEISRDMIDKANAVGGLGITMKDMTSYGGNGVNRPAAVDWGWGNAMKFVNWLNTSKGYQVAYNTDYLGRFTLWGAGQYKGNNQYRHKDAYYFLPSVDEWYKGAYYDPNKEGGPGYWNYSTMSDIKPLSVERGTVSGAAVYGQSVGTGPADVADAGGLSAYGTMAQGGNLWEWTETSSDGINDSTYDWRELRGGDWRSASDATSLDSSARASRGSSYNNGVFGFRVASVPEPSSLSLLALGGVVMALRRRER